MWYTNHSLWRAVESTMSTLSSPPNRQEVGRVRRARHGQSSRTRGHSTPLTWRIPPRTTRAGRGHHITATERGHGPRAATHAVRAAGGANRPRCSAPTFQIPRGHTPLDLFPPARPVRVVCGIRGLETGPSVLSRVGHKPTAVWRLGWCVATRPVYSARIT